MLACVCVAQAAPFNFFVIFEKKKKKKNLLLLFTRQQRFCVFRIFPVKKPRELKRSKFLISFKDKHVFIIWVVSDGQTC